MPRARPDTGARGTTRRSLAAGLLLLLPLRAAAQTPLPSLSVREAHEAQKAGKLVLVDIRTPEEWADTGVPQGAIRLDMEASAFEVRLAALRLEHPGKPIALICRTANRTGTLQKKLAARGWRELVNVRGGLLGNPGDKGWLAEGLPVEAGR
jgi:rhodanese-related sulfurtransferase